MHNPFGLADDLMEPFRPRVDHVVALLSVDPDRQPLVLDSDAKKALIASLLDRIIVEDETRALPGVVARVAQSLAAVIMGEGKELWLPDWRHAPPPPE